MLRALFLLVLTAGMTGTATADIYKYIDAAGNLVLTDSLPKDSALAGKAEKIETRPLMTVPAYKSGNSGPEKKKDDTHGYIVIIQSPANEAVFTRGGDAIPVAYSVDPSLKNGDQLKVLVDGAITDAASLNSDKLGKGSHTLNGKVIDASGKTVAGASVGFQIQ
jgi:hypothetical protein